MADWIIVGALGLTIALSIILRLPTSALLACLWTAGGVEYFLRRLPGPYLKVEPGLLEVLTGKWVSAAWRVRETVKLADATVTADLHRGVLEIAQGGIHYAVDLWAVEHPVEVVTRACVAATLPRVDAAEAESRDRPDTT
jgi:hypothetical protein